MNDTHAVDVLRQEIVNCNLLVKALIQDINTCPGPLEVLNELNREGRSKIGTLRSQINQLEIFAKEEVKETERTKLLKEVESHRQQLASWSISKSQHNVYVCNSEVQQGGAFGSRIRRGSFTPQAA